MCITEKLLIPSLFILTFYFFSLTQVEAEEFRICTQNLFNYGQGSKKKVRKQRNYLIQRILKAKCDVIAVQEVLGENKQKAQKHLERFAVALSAKTRKSFQALVGESFDKRIRNGFLLNQRKVKLLKQENYAGTYLPKLQVRGPAKKFSRGPFTVLIEVGGLMQPLYLINIHFKSKSKSHLDPTRTEYEITRMEMAEAVRKIAEKQSNAIVLILGDRNSDERSATAMILRGERELRDFSSSGECRLSKYKKPVCSGSLRDRDFVGLFALRKRRFAKEYPNASYRYKKRWYLYDEILVPEKELFMFERGNGRLAIGFEGQIYRGSDHKLLWVMFNVD